jgi:hypothetical protein
MHDRQAVKKIRTPIESNYAKPKEAQGNRYLRGLLVAGAMAVSDMRDSTARNGRGSRV